MEVKMNDTLNQTKSEWKEFEKNTVLTMINRIFGLLDFFTLFLKIGLLTNFEAKSLQFKRVHNNNPKL